ncbi:MAG: hypothetical protein ACYC99_00300 [Candidatus Geothermincolia bacterium]
MNDLFRRDRTSGYWQCHILRVFVSVVLVVALGMEILPWGFVERAPAVPCGQPERTFCIEPLQVCNHGDSFAGVLSNFPVLLPGVHSLLLSTETLRLVQQAAAFVPDGFHAAIDHPPQLSA